MKIERAKGGIISLFICLILILTLLSAGIGIAAAADPIVSIKPAVKDVNVNEDFSIFIEVDPNGNTVETALLNLTYDPIKVSITDVVMNGADFPINSPGDATVAGQITNIMGLNTSTTGLTTIANLAEIRMHADAAGTFTVGISGDLTKPPGDLLTPVTMNTGELRIKSLGEPLDITILHPNGGESIPLATQVQVSAHATGDTVVTSVTFSYSNNSGSDWNSIGAGTRVSGTDKDGIWNITWNTNNLDAGSNYLIKAVASDGTFSGEDQSNSTFSLITCTPPSIPTLNDPGTTGTDSSYTVSWSSVSGATSYTLEEDTSDSFGSPTIVYSGSGTSTQITGMSDGTYYYRVKACNACGCSGWSNVEDIEVEIPGENIITVDDSGGADYTTIQEAVNNAGDGYTIKVFMGTYNGHVVIDKSLKLVGENKNTTIIDGGGSGNGINITADNIEISGFTIKNCYHGVYVNSSKGLIIGNNMLMNNDFHGIFMRYSSNNTLSNNYFGEIYLFASNNNTLSNNDLRGIYLCYSSNNLLTSNTASNNDLRGICLDHSSNNVLSGNTASNNRYDGICVVASSNNLLSNNTLLNNTLHGIYMFYSSNNVLVSNTASNNCYGIYLEGSSSSNLIYHNNIIDNYNPAYDEIGTNQWDNGYPSGGNYWSDYTGIDTFSGTDQDVPGSDGIDDTSYNISGGAGAQDRYPLMQVWNESSGEFISIGSAIAQTNSTVTILVSVANVTNISGISFDLFYNSSVVTVSSVSANESFVGSSTTPNIDNLNGITSIMLTNSNLISTSVETPVINIVFNIIGGSGSSTSLDLQNVKFSESNSDPYTPTVVVDGQITVGIKGDFNGNGRIDIGDAAKVAFMVAGKVPEDLNADFNENGRVDIGDAAKIAFYLAGKVSEL